jgi:pimeloyl-ACP methyl ester carboxylesterase
MDQLGHPPGPNSRLRRHAHEEEPAIAASPTACAHGGRPASRASSATRHSLHTSAQCRPDRESVVLLHSSAASARQWDALAERLRPAFEVHAIDLHGHGRQAPWRCDRALSVHDEVAIVLPAMERAGGAHQIGHSYGGAVALHLEAARPSLVRSLAVYEPVLFHLLAHHEPPRRHM